MRNAELSSLLDSSRVPPILVTVDTFSHAKTRDHSKNHDSFAFRDHDPKIPLTVHTSVIRNVKSDDSSAFCDDFRLRHKSDTPRTFADDCERFRTIADACEHKRNDLALPPGPMDRHLKTGTRLLRIRQQTKQHVCTRGEIHTYRV